MTLPLDLDGAAQHFEYALLEHGRLEMPFELARTPLCLGRVQRRRKRPGPIDLLRAELLSNGEHLGPVGGRIVGEVFVGLLRADPATYVSAAPRWRPTLPSGVPNGFRMVDLLTFAQVDPRSRGQ